MKKTVISILLVLVANILPILASADEDYEQLQKIIITPNRFPQKFKNYAGEVTIITEEDMKNSGAQVLADIFRTTKGILVTDYYGNGARVAVDLRGFGETSASNVVVLVDGRRVNSCDLNGVDWMQIPIERIESIEIIHGGTGAVIYGDNATAGVINIITKTAKTKQPHFELYQAVGSYNMNKQSLLYEAEINKLSCSLSTTHIDTNGFRQNGEYKASDIGGQFKYRINDSITFKTTGNYHDADLGLAGSLTSSEYANESRRFSSLAQRDNNAGEEDYYLTFGLEALASQTGIGNLDFSLRRRNSSTYYPTWLLIMHSQMDTIAFTPNYTSTLDLFKRPNKLIFGIDLYKTDNKIDYYNYAPYTKTNDDDIDKDSLGFYISDSFSLCDKVSFDFGYRYEKIKYNLNYLDLTYASNNLSERQKRNQEAIKTAITYSPNEKTQLFFNASKSFRAPLTDEFLYLDAFWQNKIDTGLASQEAIELNWGIRHSFTKKVNVNLTLFNMYVDEEIYYNPITFKNDNYPKTTRQGLDMQLDLQLTKNISTFINWTYTRAKFRKGIFDDNTIPMVPLNKASAGLNLEFNNFKVLPTITYVGKKYAISDQANSQDKIDSFVRVDLITRYEKSNFEIFFNINNLFDRRYVEYAAYSSWTGDIGYYPAPGRNFVAGAKIKF